MSVTRISLIIAAAAAITFGCVVAAGAHAHHAYRHHAQARTEDDPLYMEDYPAYVEHGALYRGDNEGDPSYYPDYPYAPPAGYAQGMTYGGLPQDPREMPPAFERR